MKINIGCKETPVANADADYRATYSRNGKDYTEAPMDTVKGYVKVAAAESNTGIYGPGYGVISNQV